MQGPQPDEHDEQDEDPEYQENDGDDTEDDGQDYDDTVGVGRVETAAPFVPRVAPAPAAAPRPAVSTAPVLLLDGIRVGDVDRLWDWIRADGDRGQAFLGRPLNTSVELHTMIGQLIGAEQYGTAIIRALYCRGGQVNEHLGFGMLAPILAAEKTALMHLYLRPDARGHLPTMLASLVNLASQLAPDMHLAVYSTDAASARLFRSVLSPAGFKEQVMFVR